MADPTSLAGLVAGLRGARVLCLGDVILDRFVYGEVERVSPEAPIPVLRLRRQEEMLGGAGNVAANVAALGGRAVLVALAGEDGAAARIEALAQDRPGLALTLIADPSRPTPEKARYIANRQQLLRTDAEATHPAAGAAAEGLLAAFRAGLDEAQVVVLSDYGKGVLGDQVVKAAIAAAVAAGRPVIVDPKRDDWSAYAGASVITPNRQELARASGLPTASDDEVAAAARAVLERLDVEALVVTRAEAGISLIARGAEPAHVPTEAREVFDVSGAGDTVVATLAAALAAGASLPQAAALANLAGGIVVGKVGTAVVRGDDLVAALREHRVGQSEAKVVSAEAAGERVRQWRAQGLKIGFTNGCFDLLHPGHVALLRQARAACDRLVVGLNDDASVRRLKGAGRPVQDEVARAVVLASLADVDLVVLFAQDTPIELIRLIRPEVLVKGADYTVDQVVGAAEVQGWGGRVVLAALQEGNSTTDTIARMRGTAGDA